MSSQIVKQISTTNHRFACYDGIEGELFQYFTSKAFVPLDTRNGPGYTTSTVIDDNINNNILTIETMNSIYTYKIIGT